MWKEFNNNPTGRKVGDCAVRAVSVALGVDWETAYAMIATNGFSMGDMPSSNRVWKQYLRDYGFEETMIDTDCPNCLTVQDFCKRHPTGCYILSTCEYTSANQIVVSGTHVVAVIYGDYYDIFDSASDIPLSYFYIN